MSNLASIETEFQHFLAEHSASVIEEVADSPDRFRIVRPWCDHSVAFEFAAVDAAALAVALNPLILHERFSAIYHTDTKKLEVIWTAFKLPKSQIEVAGRSFNFKFRKRSHACEFGPSSERLKTLGRFFKPTTISDTNHRNLQSYAIFSKAKADDKSVSALDEPRSFWVSNCPAKEADLLLLIQNVNFYLTYYDAESPSVVIHSPQVSELKSAQKTRYVEGCFPSNIDRKSLDDTLLSFWYSADGGNPMMRFLLYYRILEYAAVHYVEASAKAAIKKALSAPTARDNLDNILDTVMAAVGSSKMSDAQRLQAVVRNCVDPALAWREFSANIDFFSRDTKFEGGFTVGAIVSSKDTESTYGSTRLDTLADTFRKIRNALSHGKDQETAGVIRPTTTNFKLFRPWVHLIETAAGEVVLYRGVSI